MNKYFEIVVENNRVGVIEQRSRGEGNHAPHRRWVLSLIDSGPVSFETVFEVFIELKEIEQREGVKFKINVKDRRVDLRAKGLS